jgi:hypothetical protein
MTMIPSTEVRMMASRRSARESASAGDRKTRRRQQEIDGGDSS